MANAKRLGCDKSDIMNLEPKSLSIRGIQVVNQISGFASGPSQRDDSVRGRDGYIRALGKWNAKRRSANLLEYASIARGRQRCTPTTPDAQQSDE